MSANVPAGESAEQHSTRLVSKTGRIMTVQQKVAAARLRVALDARLGRRTPEHIAQTAAFDLRTIDPTAY